MLGGAERVAGGRVHDDDAEARRGFFVDVVGADAGAGDGAETFVAFEYVAADGDAATADRAVGLGEGFFEVGAFEAGFDFVVDAVGLGGLQHLNAFFGDWVEDEDAGHGRREVRGRRADVRALKFENFFVRGTLARAVSCWEF